MLTPFYSCVQLFEAVQSCLKLFKCVKVKGPERSEEVAGAKPPTHAYQSSVKAASLDGGLDEPASKQYGSVLMEY